MREAALTALRKRRRVLTTKRDTTHPVASKVFNREFTATEPHTKWVTDITSIPTAASDGSSLSVMLDWYSRAVVGWSMSDCCDEELAENALNMAVVIVAVNTPARRIANGLSKWERWSVCHAKAIVGTTQQWRVSSGHAPEECVGNQVYSSHEQARQALFEYLEIYYNRQRRHSTLGYASPLVYEQLLM